MSSHLAIHLINSNDVGMVFAKALNKPEKEVFGQFLAYFCVFKILNYLLGPYFCRPKTFTAMFSEEKDTAQSQQQVTQQVVAISNITDFTTVAVKEQMEKVQQEVKAVIEGAIIDSSKLSLNFTV